MTSPSPFLRPIAHDSFALHAGATVVNFPGAAQVVAGLSANTDSQQVPNGGTVTAQLNEASGEVSVRLSFWLHDQWVAYQACLAAVRAGTADGPAVFTCAHPEVRARRIQRLYFDSEKMEAFSPKEGYRVTLTFKEKLKPKTTAGSTGTGQDVPLVIPGNDPPAKTSVPGSTTVKTTEEGAKLFAAGLNKLTTGDSRPGYCSSWTKEAWQATHNGDRSLFGGNANETERRFVAADMSIPWSLAAQQRLQAGDLVFYGNASPPDGHVGIYDGNGGVIGNSYAVYKARGGLPDASGRPTGFDAQGRPVDPRGTARLSDLGTPTSIGKPFKVTGKLPQGPAAPLGKPAPVPPKPVFAPSNTPPKLPVGIKLIPPLPR